VTNPCAHDGNNSTCGPAISLTEGGRKEMEKKNTGRSPLSEALRKKRKRKED
jgi:hypothetical protein